MLAIIFCAAFFSILGASSSPKVLIGVCAAWLIVAIILFIEIGSVGWWAIGVAVLSFVVGASYMGGKKR